ncbi:TfuA-like protein [Amaricoccus sp.]|uniref:TfuA-like protein n=1 Tax=Amaricoccus sp. TaxID=1872485 RepID=UPI0026368AAB|nr:TfuA-like protein [Amaricoccus sp.]HRO10677.1 TfuA-like protein [Amaricoccus sp.]
MAGDIAVLLGPTLPVAEARTHLDALYLPPAEQGSVFRAVLDHRPAAIAIVDGAFAQRPAVRHKEILWAMSQGVEMHGAASMGALRAAELAPCGMIGHGLIYRWYRRIPLADDEEVAVGMTPPELGSAPLGEALVNMRLTLRRAARRGILAPLTRAALERLARQQGFLDRSYPATIAAARAAGIAPAEIDAFEEWLPGNAVDAKRADTIALLRHLATAPRTPLPRLPFELTEAWAADLEAAGQWDDYLAFPA